MRGSEIRLVRGARNMLVGAWKQKGQEGAKRLFLPLLALFALFASPTDLQTFAQDGGAQQGGAENRQAATQNEDENIPGDRITIRQLKRMMDAKEEVVIIDTRDGSSYVGSTVKIKGAIHITIDKLEAKIKDLPKNKLIVTYCT
ncbi:MAG: hypothetical protein MOB07_03810 [Acidobacteria bacterium]|nr:hypothetical protein [Acidobacteriota bacterium]